MKRTKKVNKVIDDDEDEELWNFQSLKRTRKSDSGQALDAKSALPLNKPQRTVAKVASHRIRSQVDNSDTEDSDCLIVSTEDVDVDFKENRKRAFLSNSGINDDLISKSTSSKQTHLHVDKDELSQKLQTIKSPIPQKLESKKRRNKQSSLGKKPGESPISQNSGSNKRRNQQSSQEKKKKGESSNKSTTVKKTKRKPEKDEKYPSKPSEKMKHSSKGTCPFCQVPFSVLLRLTPDAHTMECMDLPFLENTTECPDGLSCNSCLPSHYRKYRHTLLAEARSVPQDTDVLPADKMELSRGKKSASEQDDQFVDLTLEHGSAKDDICIKISCTSKSKTTVSSTVGSLSTPERVVSTEPSPADSEVDHSDDKDNVNRNIQENKSIKRSRKQIANDFFPEKKVNGRSAGTEQADVKIEGGGFCIVDETDNVEAEKDLAELLADSGDKEDKQDGDENEKEIDDTEIQTDVPSVSNSNDDDDKGKIDNTCDTGFDDARSENELDEDGTETGHGSNDDDDDDDGYSDARNDLDQEICLKKNTTTGSSKRQSINLCDSNSELSQEEKVIPSLARKQTSIFNFFSCPKGKNNKKSVQKPSTTSCDINDLKNGLSRIASTPNLGGGKPSASFPLKRATSDVTSIRPANTDSDYDPRKGNRRMCPFYKKIPDTVMTVDAFRYGVIPGCKAYILTHFHYDHYGGLTKHFKQPLYCSKVTGNLVRSKIKVDSCYINTLPLNQPCEVEGVELTLMEANHCPGAVIIIFRLKSGQTFLHTGDFRANPAMEQYPALVGTKIHQLYLDTTYCDPAYSFPSQSEVIDFAVSLAQKHMEMCPTSLIVCGSYTIGKERVFIAIAEALKSKICVKRDKKQILDCLEDDRLTAMVTLNPDEAQVHVLPMGKLNPRNLGEYLGQLQHFTSILALEPTGWSHSNRVVSLDQIRPKYSRNGITVYGIPYSEHSSYLEMKRFTQFIRPDRILPTVNNGNPQSRKKMEDIFRKWMSEIKAPGLTKKETEPTNKQASLASWFKK